MSVGVFCVERFNQSRACIFIFLVFILDIVLVVVTLFCMVLGSHYIHVLSGVNVEKTQAHYMGIRTRNACILEQMSKTSVPNLTNKPNSVN